MKFSTSVAALVASTTTSTPYSQYTELKFLHEGTVSNSDVFYRNVSSTAMYLECENCTASQYSWSTTAYQPLFKEVPTSACDVQTSLVSGWDRPGGENYSSTITDSLSECSSSCCDDNKCRSFVWTNAAPEDNKDCVEGSPCCNKKSDVPALLFRVVDDFPNKEDIVSGVKQIQGEVPPLGMRSAVPLGGLGAGVFELRGDGSMHEWTIANQSPGGAAKIGLFDDALLGYRLSSDSESVGEASSKMIRTHPPKSAGDIEGVESIVYSGAYPVSKLRLIDASDKLTTATTPTLFAHSRLRTNDLAHSAAPGVVFSLALDNPTDAQIDAEFLFNLPLNIEQDTQRLGSVEDIVASSILSTTDPVSCLAQCNEHDDCAAWNLQVEDFNCTLFSKVALNNHADGYFSGVKAAFSTAQGDGCITMSRTVGEGPTKGDASVCGEVESTRFVTGNNVAEVWEKFNNNNNKEMQDITAQDAYGAAITKINIPPNSSATLSLSFAWYFPARDYMGHEINNHYAQLWESSAEVGAELLASVESDVKDIDGFHDTFFDSSLPEFLTDALVNSFSHVRSAWWREANSDEKSKTSSSTLEGPQWRQWEAMDCVNIDSVHNDGERHVPYITLFPEAVKSKMNGWSHSQGENGMIAEQLGCGCTGSVDDGGAFDEGCGEKWEQARVMSDVSSMYIVYLHELYKFGGDVDVLKTHWDTAKKAVVWHLNTANSTSSGLLESMCNTYDIANPPKYQLVTYNEVFHLLALKAASSLARSEVVNDIEFADECDKAFEVAQSAVNELLWNEEHEFYQFNNENPGDMMADSLYPQVLAYTNGLGDLVAKEKTIAHLAKEVEYGDSPYGITLLTTNFGEDFLDLGNQGNGVWQMATGDWSALNLRLRGKSGMSEKDSFSQVEKSIRGWRNVVNDLWNVAGISDQSSGSPTITSHYGYWMTMWQIVYAASGQDCDMVAGVCKFDVAVDLPCRLPVLLSGTLGMLSSSEEGESWKFEVKAGKGIGLTRIEVGGVGVDLEGGKLEVGDKIEWKM